MNFQDFKKDVEAAFKNMIADTLFVANVDKDLLWTGYLLSFEDDDIRQDHNCNACKSFIRHYGKVVAIDPRTFEIKTFWDDVHTPGYEKTAKELAKLVKEAGIADIFIQDVNEFHGCDHNIQLLPDGTTRTWTHLFVQIPNQFKFNKRVHNFDTAPIAKIRNTAMGTLLIDLSNGVELERAVRAYENIMAPANYKRPTALITKKQIEAAQKKVEELGLTDALPRRHAHVEDISVNDVLFVNRDTRARMKGGMFDALTETAMVNPKEFTKATEVSAQKFVTDILPGAKDVSILVENRHIPNFVTLTAPENPDANQLFKWNNNFAWVYNGSVADSFKEKVKAAGGNVNGFLRCSLHWFNYDDLDLHVTEPGGSEIYFGHKNGYSGGVLDVDMNAGSGKTRDAVENIIWTDPSRIRTGSYRVRVHNFARRESIDVGFEMEIEINGEIHKFNYSKMIPHGDYVDVARIEVDRQGNISLTPSIPEGTTSFKSVNEWGIDTMKFQKVSCIMFSPNHWELGLKLNIVTSS